VGTWRGGDRGTTLLGAIGEDSAQGSGTEASMSDMLGSLALAGLLENKFGKRPPGHAHAYAVAYSVSGHRELREK